MLAEFPNIHLDSIEHFRSIEYNWINVLSTLYTYFPTYAFYSFKGYTFLAMTTCDAPIRGVSYSIQNRTGPDQVISVRSSVQGISIFGLRSSPDLDRWTE